MEEIPIVDSSVINAFNLCWDAILQESKRFNNVFFQNKHCTILDSRDANFDDILNRLSYTYMYGCYNIIFFEKCISNFLNECPEIETIFPFGNLKVCSLSNGPGLDIIGLLCALCRTNKRLKCFPQLKAINFYESWLSLYKYVIRAAYEKTTLLSYSEYFQIPPDNIHLIQGDLFSALSTEVRNCISNSNILLMVKVYVSSKAGPNIVAESLKEIFSLLEPGSLIFFVGSKNNLKQISSCDHLNNYVKGIYGPQQVSINSLLFDKGIAATVGVEPHETGSAQFVVWQKRNVIGTQEPIKTKKKKTRRKKNTSKKLKNGEKPLNSDDDITNEYNDDTDAGSDVSFASGSKKSDTLLDELKCDTSSSTCNSISSDEIKSKNSVKEHNLPQNDFVCSVDNIASVLDKVCIDDSNNEKQKLKEQITFQSDKNNTSAFVDNTQELKSEIRNLKNVTKSKKKEKETETSNSNPQIMKKGIEEGKVNFNFTNADANSASIMFQSKLLPLVTQNLNHDEKKVTSCSIKPKNKVQSVNKAKIPLELNIKNVTPKKQPKSSQKNLSVSQSLENLSLKVEENTVIGHRQDTQGLTDRNTSSFHSLLQRCNSIVTSLEKLTADIKNISSSNNDQCCVRRHCCERQACQNYRIPHLCSCFANAMHVCCSCRMMGNATCRNCLPFRNNDVPELQIDSGRSTNISRPYIKIPLQNNEIVQILTSRRSYF